MSKSEEQLREEDREQQEERKSWEREQERLQEDNRLNDATLDNWQYQIRVLKAENDELRAALAEVRAEVTVRELLETHWDIKINSEDASFAAWWGVTDSKWHWTAWANGHAVTQGPGPLPDCLAALKAFVEKKEE